jgi:endonuclease/exonuclease/phosphatase family metal-dependent hydrolase
MRLENGLIRVMSYNIRYDNVKDGENSWQYRKAKVCSVVRFHRADIIGLQEALKHQVNDLVEQFPEYDWLGVGRTDGIEQGEFAAIFYLKDRFEPVMKGNFWLSEEPDIPGKKGWDAYNIRIVTWAKFIDKVTGRYFFHFNTHFDLTGEKARRESSSLLLNRVECIGKGEPCIITGDFNSEEGSAAYNILTGVKFERAGYKGLEVRDSKYASMYKHHGPSSTYLGNFEYGTGTGKIDYIFIKNDIKVYQHGVLADHWDGKSPSDHMPVIADVVIGKCEEL